MKGFAAIVVCFLSLKPLAQTKLLTVPGQSYAMQEHEVTIEQFAKFVEETHYQTDVEKAGKGKGYSKNSGKIVLKTGLNFTCDLYGVPVARVDWPRLPVAHVSFNDALAYAKWLGSDYDIPDYQQWFAAATAGIKKYKLRYP